MAAIVWDCIPKLKKGLCLPGEEIMDMTGDDSQDDEESEASKGHKTEKLVKGGGGVDREGGSPYKEALIVKEKRPPEHAKKEKDNGVYEKAFDGIALDYFAVRMPNLIMMRVW